MCSYYMIYLIHTDTGWCPPATSWFMNPISCNYIYHKSQSSHLEGNVAILEAPSCTVCTCVRVSIIYMYTHMYNINIYIHIYQGLQSDPFAVFKRHVLGLQSFWDQGH